MARIAVVSDLHTHDQSKGHIARIFTKGPVEKVADILLLGGDLTQDGKPSEAEILLNELTDVRIPIYAVLGNHDYQSSKSADILKILGQKMTILDGDGVDIDIGGTSVGLAGVKGFCGGFEPHPAAAFGEKALKDFVYAGEREVEKLDEALSELNNSIKVVLMHYAPIKETIIGESPEVYSFLGSWKLSRPIDFYKTSIVFHGHAHHGRMSGQTDGGIPVYNTAKILYRNNYVVFELKGGKWEKKS